MVKLTKHITLKEACHSEMAKRKGIDNCPPKELIEVMRHTALCVFEPLRNYFEVPIKINSFYRSKKINRLIGGSRTSQHIKGEAIDIDDVYSQKFGVTNKDFFHWLKNHVNFDQLIWEFGDDDNPAWVHVSCNPNINRNRHQVLRSRRINGKTIYEIFE